MAFQISGSLSSLKSTHYNNLFEIKALLCHPIVHHLLNWTYLLTQETSVPESLKNIARDIASFSNICWAMHRSNSCVVVNNNYHGKHSLFSFTTIPCSSTISYFPCWLNKIKNFLNCLCSLQLDLLWNHSSL
jgi:hypothetical protein